MSDDSPLPDRGPQASGLGPSPHNELHARLLAVVEQFGHSPPSKTRSRRHGHQPHARQHVEDYLAHTVLNVTARELARRSGRHHSTVMASIRKGEQLVKGGAEARGFDDPHPDDSPPVDRWSLAYLEGDAGDD